MRRVVVTGMGAITALGDDVAGFQKALLATECGIAPTLQFDTKDNQVKISAEVKNYDPKAHFNKGQIAQLDRFAQFALLSAREAVADSGLEFDADLGSRTCVIHGTGIGGQNTQEDNYHKIFAEGGKRVHPFTIPKLIPSSNSSQISIEFGITGPAFTTASACSSAGHAIGMSLMMLRQGMVDVAITGGAESCINYGTILAWEALRVAAKDTCRPFSGKRGGMVVGEGGATLILETLEHAQARGAKIYAELVGLGMSSDALNIVQPSEDGATRAIQGALDDAGLRPEDIQYINAHGTGTPQNDPTETAAVRRVFGAHADKLAISSTKSMHGHTLGAAAAVESIATITALNEQIAPATANYLEPDPKCDLDYVVNEARPMEINAALSTSFAFGGLNAVLAYKRFVE